MSLAVGEAADGASRRFVGIVRDLSTQRAAEQRARATLASAEKFADPEDVGLLCERTKLEQLIAFFSRDFPTAIEAGQKAVEAARQAGLAYEVAINLHLLGEALFRNEARCATCHQGRDFTDVLSGPSPAVPFLHDPAETGMDPGYAERTATGRYRTTPLRGLLQHPPYFHDGSAPDLAAVVNHYDAHFGLNLTAAQKADLVEYLKSL